MIGLHLWIRWRWFLPSGQRSGCRCWKRRRGLAWHSNRHRATGCTSDVDRYRGQESQCSCNRLRGAEIAQHERAPCPRGIVSLDGGCDIVISRLCRTQGFRRMRLPSLKGRWKSSTIYERRFAPRRNRAPVFSHFVRLRIHFIPRKLMVSAISLLSQNPTKSGSPCMKALPSRIKKAASENIRCRHLRHAGALRSACVARI